MITLWFLNVWLAMMAAEPAGTGQTYAVVVGISDYQVLSYANGDLRYADKDARQMVEFLRSKSGGRAAPAHIRLLTNQQATQANIYRAMTLFREARPGDRVILYFSGHGFSDSFVPYDVKPGSREKLLTHQAVKAAFHASKASTKLCIADACLSGSMAQSGVQRKRATFITSDSPASTNVAMLLASRSTQSAIETRQLKGGAFTYYLLKGLSGQADQNRDRVVTIRELHRYVSPLVRQTSRGRQTPVFYGRFSDNLALSYL